MNRRSSFTRGKTVAHAGGYPQGSPSSGALNWDLNPGLCRRRPSLPICVPPGSHVFQCMSCPAEWMPLPEEAPTELGQPQLTPTFHLNEVQLVDGLQQRLAVQGQLKLRGHFGLQGSFDPLLLRHLDTLDQGVRDLKGSTEFRVSTCKGKIA